MDFGKIKKIPRVCYMGISSPEFSRTRVYLSALKMHGAQIIECFVDPRGLQKFLLLFSKHRGFKNAYDVLVVAYPGHRIVWFARLLTRKPVVFDALCTLWESETLSHEARLFKQIRIKFIDWLAVHCSTVVLVESESQKKFFIERFGGSPEKYQVVYTGVDEAVFTFNETPKLPRFTVVFRGRLSHESGVEYFVRAAKILEDENIFFRVIGYGYNLTLIQKIIKDLNIKNLEVVSERLTFSELKNKMAECHISVGQLSNSERLKRTIPHKAFESLVLGLPYITARAEAISEILEDGESCIMVLPASPEKLAEAIILLKNNPKYAQDLAKSAYNVFNKKLSQRALGEKLIAILKVQLRDE